MELSNLGESSFWSGQGDRVELLLAFVFVLFVVFLREVAQEPFFLEKISVLSHSWEEDEDFEDQDEGSAILAKHIKEELEE